MMFEIDLIPFLAVNALLAVAAYFVFVPALQAKLRAHGHAPNLAYLALLPVLFMLAVLWFLFAPDQPTKPKPQETK